MERTRKCYGRTDRRTGVQTEDIPIIPSPLCGMEFIKPNLQHLLLKFGLIAIKRPANYQTFIITTVDRADVKIRHNLILVFFVFRD